MNMRTVSLLCFLAALSALICASAADAGQVPPDRRIITLKAGANPLTVARRNGIVLGNVYYNALKGFVGRGSASALKQLAADPDVLRVEQDSLVHAIAQTLPTGVSRIGAPLNAYAQINGKDERIGVDVAIIDTGIDLTHAELNVVFNRSFVSGETSGQDKNGHGTHVAGIIGAIDNTAGVVGVAPGARLWALKVLDASGSGYMSDIIKAIDYVAANADKIAVINMSLGGQGKITSFRTAIQNCVSRGVVVVVAAGNDSKDVYGPDKVFGTSDDFIPAAYPEVCSVSALADSDGKAGGLGAKTSYGPDDTLATFSNYSRYIVANPPVKSPGAAIDLAAPGVSIRSTYLGNTYSSLSGTSMASPHVAGSVALYIAEHGRASNAAGVYAIRQALVNAAQPQTQWGPANTADPDSNHEGCVYVGGSTTPPANTAPTVTITSPAKNATFASGATITFTGSATDTQDGSLTADLAWTSSRDGAIGNGGTFSNVLSDGTHTITASVTDEGGLTGSATVTITVGNTAPTVAITSPKNGVTYTAGTAISFAGTATDTQDGSLTSKLAWTSNLAGALGTGGSFTKSLTAGTHTITASATDKGSLTGSAAVTILVQAAGNTRPAVAITSPAKGASFDASSVITFTGTAADAQNGDLTDSLAWTSSIDGAIGTGGTCTATLIPGTHTITASATDTGNLTGSASITLTVRSSGGGSTQLVVTVTTDKSVYGWWDTPIFTVRVTDGTNPVRSATVKVTLLTPTGGWLSASGTSDSTGTFRCYYRPNTRRDGYGWFNVLATATKRAYTGGNGSAWFLLWY